MSGLIKHLGEMDKKEVDIVCNLIKSDSDHVNLLSNNKSDFNRVLQLAGLSLKRLRERPAITELVEKELGLKHRPKSLPGPKVELSQYVTRPLPSYTIFANHDIPFPFSLSFLLL